jgi:hypothetical protein
MMTEKGLVISSKRDLGVETGITHTHRHNTGRVY